MLLSYGHSLPEQPEYTGSRQIMPTFGRQIIAMQIVEENLRSTWRSVKFFCFSGKIEPHNAICYTELSVDDQGVLRLKYVPGCTPGVELQPGQWSIGEVRKRWYLFSIKKQAFELITVERDNLVLSDVIKGEKIFFAPLPAWYQRIEPAETAVRHIRPDKKNQNG